MRNGSLLPVVFLCVFGASGCLRSSYRDQYTAVELSAYRKPDSLLFVSEEFSAASMFWKNYYTDRRLEALIDTALARNLTLYGSMLRLEKAAGYFDRTRGDFWPSVDLRLTQNQLKVHPRPKPSNTHGIGLTLSSWEIDLWGRLRSTKRAAMEAFLRQEASMQGVKVKLIADVATLYYRLVGLDTKLLAVQEIIRSNEAYLIEQEARRRAEIAGAIDPAGRRLPRSEMNRADITRSDLAVEQARAELFRAKALKPEIESDIFITENALNLLLSRDRGTIERSPIDEILTEGQLADSIRIGVPADLVRFRPDVMAAEKAVREAFHLKDAARAARYPALTLQAGFTTEESFYGSWSDFSGSVIYNLFAGLTQPIFRRGELRYNRRARTIECEQRIAEFRQTLFAACMEISNTLMYYKMKHATAANLSKRYEALFNAWNYSRRLYSRNQASYLDVLAAQSQLLQTRMELSDAFIAYCTQRIALFKALGGGALQ